MKLSEPTMKIKLSKPCDICKKDVYLGDNLVIIKSRTVHLECYDKDIINFLKRLLNTGSGYAIREMIDFKLKELKK